MVDITHDALNRTESVVHMGRVVHRQHNASNDHYYQRKTRKNSKIPHVVEIFWNRIVICFMIKHRKDRQTVVDPSYNRI